MKLQVAIVAFSTSFCREEQETDALHSAVMGMCVSTLKTNDPKVFKLGIGVGYPTSGMV